MRFFQISILILSGIIFSVSSFAGSISPQLTEKLQLKTNSEVTKVWITLPSFGSGKQMRSELVSNYSKRIDRHREGIFLLKENHQTSQAKLKNYFQNLIPNKSRNIKYHWLVNLVVVELTKSEIEAVALRDDVEVIYLVPQVVAIESVDNGRSMPALSASVGENITYMNAPAAWADGYTGAGRVVCSFDTGVDGDHPALFNNWKGHDGDSAAAWFDPVKQLPFPHAIPDCGCDVNHGTHTMGTMVGHDDVSGDTVGVALDAKWISAASLDILGSSLVDAFEWAADPDRNPNTIEDVPDVINHSWGIPGLVCEDLFYDLIENTEALGIVNIFAAGNEGPTVSTIRNPADRALDSLDCFAIGSVNHSNSLISGSSSRGPSLCPVSAIKPNVSAPGLAIRSTLNGGNYGFKSGTSMAAPHVSGLVALLRQKNPNATVDEIKTAILISAVDLGNPGADNDYGWGRIDCMAALNALSSVNADPNVLLYSFDHLPVAPGDILEGTINLTNLGASVNSITCSIIDVNPALNILNGSASFGTIVEGDTVRSASLIRIEISDTVTVGSIMSLDMEINGTGYIDTLKLFILVEPLPTRSFVTHNVGNIEFSLSNFGTFGLGPDANSSFFPVGGIGFTYSGGDNELFEGGLMVGRSFNSVSDGVRNVGGEPDGDFAVMPGGNISFVTPIIGVTQQSYARFDDSRTANPNGVEIVQNCYAFDYAPYTDLLILQYIITNVSGGSLNNLYVGLYMDWDVTSYSQNSGGYEPADDFSWIAYRNGSLVANYRGVKVLEPELHTSYTEDAVIAYFPAVGDAFTENEKITSLSDGIGSADTYKNNVNDLLQVTSAQISLSAGQVDTVAFALIAGETFAGIQDAASQSINAYIGILTDIDDPVRPVELPGSFSLGQNYPNPFNPTTTISFDLPTKSEYRFEIFNLAGQKLFDKMTVGEAGVHTIIWDASDYSSGVYLYKLTTEKFVESKKMMLLK